MSLLFPGPVCFGCESHHCRQLPVITFIVSYNFETCCFRAFLPAGALNAQECPTVLPALVRRWGLVRPGESHGLSPLLHVFGCEVSFLTTQDGCTVGHPGGSVVEHLPSAQGVTLGSRDRVRRQAPCMEPVSPSACLCLSLWVSHE